MTRETGQQWDIFLAYASDDRQQAFALVEALPSQCRIYMDQLRVQPGDDWPQALQDAQRQSSMTVALIAEATFKNAYYLKDEIISAIKLCRQMDHRLIPVYIDDWMDPPPYGLAQKQGISVLEEGGMKGVAERIVAVVQNAGLVMPRFRTLGWEDVQAINDLLNTVFPDASSARHLQHQLATLIGVCAFGRHPEVRWRNTLDTFLRNYANGLKPVLEIAWSLAPGDPRFHPFEVADNQSPRTGE